MTGRSCRSANAYCNVFGHVATTLMPCCTRRGKAMGEGWGVGASAFGRQQNLRISDVEFSAPWVTQRFARRKFQALPRDAHDVRRVLESLVLGVAAERDVGGATPIHARSNCFFTKSHFGFFISL